jgi:type I restriction enzyme, S subunit
MEMKPGYKQTEVGVIPEDWEIRTVGQIADIKTGPFGSALHEKDYVDDGTPIITVEHLGEHGVQHTNLPMISDVDKARLKAYSLRSGDIVFSRVGSVDRNALIKEAESGWLFSGRLLRVRPAREQIYSPYLSYHFHSETFKQRVRDVAVGQTMASLNTKILMGVKAVLPPTKAEQEAIAKVLSDADALIESLEQLIAKKCHLKQGAMQELLTGKKRLPGFSGEWETKRLRDLLTYERPDRYIVHNTEYAERGNLPVLTANKSFILGYTDEDFGVCRSIPVIVFDDFTTGSKFATFPFKVKSSAIKLLRPKHDRVSLRYTFERMQLIHFPLGDHKRYYISEYQNIELLVPDYDEQLAIVTVLSDMDARIAALEAKLAKARQLKQGMMQELLMGRIRLI